LSREGIRVASLGVMRHEPPNSSDAARPQAITPAGLDRDAEPPSASTGVGPGRAILLGGAALALCVLAMATVIVLLGL
jgi:hypothetical protein